MKFKCPECGKIINRDMRINSTKFMLTKDGEYKSFCMPTGKKAKCKPVSKQSTYQGSRGSNK